MSEDVRIGISTCPNDTFAFAGLLEGRVEADGVRLHFELADVEALNLRFLAGELDVAKVSFHAALLASDRLRVLKSGSALGFGVGPVLLAAPGASSPDVAVATETGPRPARVLCPGAHTTATLLYRLFHGSEGSVEQVVFSEIMPALATRQAEFGVCIHEGRFTYEGRGLRLVEDLGATWEARTDAPLPLGGIVARRDLDPTVVTAVQNALHASLEMALADRIATLPTLRAHAQELDDDAIWKHVDLYVNAWTLDLGAPGQKALATLDARAREAGIAPDLPPLEILT